MRIYNLPAVEFPKHSDSYTVQAMIHASISDSRTFERRSEYPNHFGHPDVRISWTWISESHCILYGTSDYFGHTNIASTPDTRMSD